MTPRPLDIWAVSELPATTSRLSHEIMIWTLTHDFGPAGEWRGHPVTDCGPWCQGPALLEALLIAEKLGLDGNVEAAMYARDHGLL